MLARVQARKEQRANKGKARGGSINLRMHNLVRSQVPQKAVFKVAGLEKTRHHEKVAQELIVDASNRIHHTGLSHRSLLLGAVIPQGLSILLRMRLPCNCTVEF